MKTKVLITGASGFVGGSITEKFLEDGTFEPSVLVRSPEAQKRFTAKGVRVHIADVTQPDTLTRPLAAQDVVIHCAALMSNFDSSPKKYFYETNVIGTVNLLEACDLRTLKQFIHISTAGVYGDTGNEPASEGRGYGLNLSAYEWSKKESEVALLKYAKEYKVPFTLLRPSQLYGPGMRYGWPQTINSIKYNRMYIPGRGRAKIHLLHIDDFVKAVKLIVGNKTAIYKIYNVAGPEILDLRNVFGLIAEEVGARPPKAAPYIPVYALSVLLSAIPYALKSEKARLLTPHRVRFFATNHVYDMRRIMEELHYGPSITVREGFREMIRWCEKERL